MQQRKYHHKFKFILKQVLVITKISFQIIHIYQIVYIYVFPDTKATKKITMADAVNCFQRTLEADSAYSNFPSSHFTCAPLLIVSASV